VSNHDDARSHLTGEVLHRYFLVSYALVAIATIPFLYGSWRSGVVPGLYSVTLFLAYSGFYLLPALVIIGACYLLLCGFRTPTVARRTRNAVVVTLAVSLVALVEFALIVDSIVVRDFGFHLNGFVLNLVTTPGGLESMGLGETLPVTCAIVIGGLLAVQYAGLRLARSRRFRSWLRPRNAWILAVALVFVSVGEHLIYIAGDVRSDSEILSQARAFPFYQPKTARKLARKWGLESKRGDRQVASVADDESPLAYPRRPIEVDVPAHPLNIVWLVGESLRFDALAPDIMPRTWALSERASAFKQHFSGGNGTRMGVFSMFYGLHGPYWFSFLNERRGPVLIDVLRDQNYQMSIHTSARFSYPEFDRTVFFRVPDRDMYDSADTYYSKSMDRGWKEDAKHTDEIVDFLKTRDPQRPFFVYMFFESTHYRYYFPDGTAVREPYLEDMSLAALGTNYTPELLYNRYLNAAHHLDSQVGRILEALDETGDSANTIVLVTGDHGEEFMEKGRQGHNSEFHDEQVHVPLVLSVPGGSPRRVDGLTSHVDIVPTLLPMLGVTNPPEDYSLGHDLLANSRRRYVVVADWSRIAVIDADHKLTVPVGGNGMLETTALTTHDDTAVGDFTGAFKAVRPELSRVMSELVAFRARGEQTADEENPLEIANRSSGSDPSPDAVVRVLKE